MPRYGNHLNVQVTHVLEGHAALTLRSRLRCILMRKEDELNNVSGNSPFLMACRKMIDLL
jgi:hypothetical protein